MIDEIIHEAREAALQAAAAVINDIRGDLETPSDARWIGAGEGTHSLPKQKET